MDWKRLVQFALLSSSDLEQSARPAGARFAGAVLRHLRRSPSVLSPATRRTHHETLVMAKVPFPRPMTYFVSGV